MNRLPLYIPIPYKEASQKQRDEICNGCGAKDGIKVPNTFWGLKIKFACQIHDWMYHDGKTLGDYYFSNIMFFWNMIALIINGSNWFMTFIRAERALKYFLAVMFKSGKNAYWTDKEKNDTMTITIKGELT